jgi:hypothetical protein
LCAGEALINLISAVPVVDGDPLFCWRDAWEDIRPAIWASSSRRILVGGGGSRPFGHSLRIGDASYLLAEVVHLAGRWRSQAYEAYIRAFEQVVIRHYGHILPEN